jgi:transcriptional regulator with XRE-family HTH domain
MTKDFYLQVWEGDGERKGGSDSEPRTLGFLIKFHRERQGITQEQLARTLGTNQTRISQWETDAARPRRPALLRLAKALNVSADQLAHASSFTFPGRDFAFDPDYFSAYDRVSKLGPGALSRFIRIVVLLADLLLYVTRRRTK